MINKATIVGRLTDDPQLRFTQNGTAVCQFTLASQRPFKNQNGDYEADFIRIVVWRKPAENAAEYLAKGRMAAVDGRIQTRNYENQQGQRVYVTEIVADQVQFLDSRNNNSNGLQNSSNDDDPFANNGPVDISDDDLPF